MSAKNVALTIGIIFIAVGLLGFIDNPIVGASENAIFHADSLHNGVHIGSGVLFVLIALAAPTAISGFMILFGLIYLLLGVLGLVNMGSGMEGTEKLLGILHVNGADNYLHVALGLVILIAGIATRRKVVVNTRL
jgi:hypothetical protein